MGEVVSLVKSQVPVRAVLAIIQNAGAKELTVDLQYVGHQVGIGTRVEAFEETLASSGIASNVRRCGTTRVSFKIQRQFGEINLEFRELLAEAFKIETSEVTIIAQVGLTRP